MVKIYQQAFAHAGTKQVIPDVSDPQGFVSNEDGFTTDYELPDTDPNYKPIERAEFNGLMSMVTEAVGEIQQFGFAKWQPITWPQGARVVDGGVVYRALTQTSQQPPHADWVVNANQPWSNKAVGEEVWLDDSNSAVEVPPTDNPNFRYIKLSAGENGSGGYNEGILINETVSGSAPLIEAMAEISLPDSPFHGQTVRLLNTERRFVRAGEAGVAQDDQMQQITGSVGWAMLSSSSKIATGALDRTTTRTGEYEGGNAGEFSNINIDSSKSPGARTGNETRPRNIGRTVYMRIL